MKYTNVDQLRKYHPVGRLCKLLAAAKSGYQTWSAGKVAAPSKLADQRLVVAIQAAHQRGRGTYGAHKIRA